MSGTAASSAAASTSSASSGGYSYRREKRASAAMVPAFNMTVPSTDPLWFYCAQAMHCESGMVFAVNPPTSGNKTFTAFQASAKNQSSTTEPTTGQQGGTSGTVMNSTATSNSMNAVAGMAVLGAIGAAFL